MLAHLPYPGRRELFGVSFDSDRALARPTRLRTTDLEFFGPWIAVRTLPSTSEIEPVVKASRRSSHRSRRPLFGPGPRPVIAPQLRNASRRCCSAELKCEPIHAFASRASAQTRRPGWSVRTMSRFICSRSAGSSRGTTIADDPTADPPVEGAEPTAERVRPVGVEAIDNRRTPRCVRAGRPPPVPIDGQ